MELNTREFVSCHTGLSVNLQHSCVLHTKVSRYDPVSCCCSPISTCTNGLHNLANVSLFLSAEMLRMFPVTFEKDDDSNGHIDFITAASVSCLCRDLGCDIIESIDYVCRDGTDTQYNYDNAKIFCKISICQH